MHPAMTADRRDDGRVKETEGPKGKRMVEERKEERKMVEERKAMEQRKALLLARKVKEDKARARGRALEDIRWRLDSSK